MEWIKDDSGLSIADIERRQAYKMHPHLFKTRKKFPYAFCSHCGLINLRNELSQWCVKMGCNASDHPQFASKVRG